MPKHDEVTRTTTPLTLSERSNGRIERRPKGHGRWRRRLKRLAIAFAIATPVGLGLLWLAVDRVGWLGPRLADAGRTVLGTDAVSRIEDWVYGVEDRWNRWWRRDEKPAARWTIPVPTATQPDVAATNDVDATTNLVEFRPSDVGPVFKAVSAPGDGVWMPVVDPARPDDRVLLCKTLLHPDPRRSWAELFVVAMDLRQIHVFAAAGTVEPEASTAEGQRYVRRGLIPEKHRAALVAAFNGGFKAEHGKYGMSVDGVTLLPPRDRACTIAGYTNHDLRIGTWTALSAGIGDMAWWRQTPSCMIENGRLHPGLASEDATHWGSALGGETVVRRSAVGINADRTVLYMAVSNATTARAIALGMQHAGATELAQLDINWSYPHFVMFRRLDSGEREGFPLFEGFVYEDNEYLSRPSTRDFFYATRKPR